MVDNCSFLLLAAIGWCWELVQFEFDWNEDRSSRDESSDPIAAPSAFMSKQDCNLQCLPIALAVLQTRRVLLF